LRKVDDGGAAWIGGARSGDRILAVNDISVTQRNHKELVQLIKGSPNPMSMILLASAEMIQIPPDAMAITIAKGPRGYGFNLGRKGAVQFLKAVDAGGPTEVVGGSAGDVIHEINGIAITGLTHKDLVRLVKAGGDKVHMKITKELYQRTTAEAAMAEQKLAAGNSAQQAASQTIAQARQRAAAAMQARRAEEELLLAARQREQELQLVLESIQDIRERTDVSKKRLVSIEEQIKMQRIATAKVATSAELKELEDMLVIIEAEAINDLNTKQESLPTPSKKLSEVAAAKVQLAEMTWEYEVIVCREHLAESRLEELKALAPAAEQRRKDEKKRSQEQLASVQEQRKKDLEAIEARKKAMDQKLDDIRKAREDAAAEDKKQRDEAEARRKAEAEERRKQAKAFKDKQRQANDALSLAEEKRRAQEEADREYAERDARIQAERKEKQRLEAIAKEEAEEEARQREAAQLFGVKKRKVPPPLRPDQVGGGNGGLHPMLAALSDMKVAPGSKIDLYAPPKK